MPAAIPPFRTLAIWQGGAPMWVAERPRLVHVVLMAAIPASNLFQSTEEVRGVRGGGNPAARMSQTETTTRRQREVMADT